MSINVDFIKRCEHVYFNHNACYPWVNIVNGVRVGGRNFAAVQQNTFRGFHRCDKNLPGAKEVFTNYFCVNSGRIIHELRNLNDKMDYEGFLEIIKKELLVLLSKNIVQRQLLSYNKIRKPIDLYFQHLVSMSNETTELRSKITPFMNLPLDSQIFEYDSIFTLEELKKFNLNRKSSYGDVTSKETYQKLQSIILDKCYKISKKNNSNFYPIYFDLIWGGRINRPGNSLFEMNPQ